jgi:hypothetical protein
MKTRTSKRILKRLAILLIPCLTAGALTVAAQADNLAAKVKGKGMVDMVTTGNDTFLDPPAYVTGDEFADNHFAIKGNVQADGSASGTAHFAFCGGFPAAYGVDLITLECEIDTGSVSEDGTVVLQGFSFEEDLVDGVVVFEELSPFEIIIDPAGSSSLRWCQIPALDLEITKGHLKVK